MTPRMWEVPKPMPYTMNQIASQQVGSVVLQAWFCTRTLDRASHGLTDVRALNAPCLKHPQGVHLFLYEHVSSKCCVLGALR